MKIKGQDLETNNDGKKKSDGSKRSVITARDQKQSRCDVIGLVP